MNIKKIYKKKIHDILISKWDPIGVKDIPEAQDEYDIYISAIYTLISKNVGQKALHDYLRYLEQERMQLNNKEVINEVVMELMKILVNI